MEPTALLEWLDASLTSLTLARDEAYGVGMTKMANVLDKMADAICAMIVDVDITIRGEPF